MVTENTTALTVPGHNAPICNKTINVTAITRAEAGSADYCPHVSAGQVKLMAIVAGKNKRHGERNALLIKFLFDGCFRVSEAIGVRWIDVVQSPEGYAVQVHAIDSKTKKGGMVAISASIAGEIKGYLYDHHINEHELIFPISRAQAYRVVINAFDAAGIPRPTKERDHVGGLHVLRHSGAIERLKLTGNPRAVQHQLRHQSSLMTLRYMKTVQADESLAVNQSTEIWK